MDSLHGKEGGHFSGRPPLTPRGPTSHERAASSTGGNCRIPPFPPMRDRAPRKVPRNPYEDTRCQHPAVHFRSREWTYYDSIRSPLSNLRVQLRRAHELHPSYADVHTQRRFGVGTPVRGSSILRLAPPHIPAANPNGCHWRPRRKVGSAGIL